MYKWQCAPTICPYSLCLTTQNLWIIWQSSAAGKATPIGPSTMHRKVSESILISRLLTICLFGISTLFITKSRIATMSRPLKYTLPILSPKHCERGCSTSYSFYDIVYNICSTSTYNQLKPVRIFPYSQNYCICLSILDYRRMNYCLSINCYIFYSLVLPNILLRYLLNSF